jgi:hypothetical protein
MKKTIKNTVLLTLMLIPCLGHNNLNAKNCHAGVTKVVQSKGSSIVIQKTNSGNIIVRNIIRK